MLVLATLLLALLFSAQSSYGDEVKRIGLVIGNQQYKMEVGRLNNPHRDAELVKQALTDIGFKVEQVRDASRAATSRAIKEFAIKLGSLGNGAIGFVYYSGHGASRPMYNTNYIIPVDVNRTSDPDFWDNAVAVEAIEKEFKTNSPNAAVFIVIDACRNQLRVPLKSIAKGFTKVSEEAGFFIALSTSPNQTASDEGDDGGPYSNALARELRKPGLDHLQLFQNVKTAVYSLTKKAQIPWESNGLIERVYLNPDKRSIPEASPWPEPPSSKSEGLAKSSVPQASPSPEPPLSKSEGSAKLTVPTLECNFNLYSFSEGFCPAGGKITKHGSGNLQLFVEPGVYEEFSMDGSGNVCLTGIDDYSNIHGKMNGTGNLYYNPDNYAKGRPPTVQILGSGGIRRGSSVLYCASP